MQTGPIWIVDNDAEDRDIVREIWHDLQLPNELVFCKSADETFALLEKVETAPFIIISEVNLPGGDGFTLRERLLETHAKKFKSVPFIFWSTQATEEQITRAYDLSVHGFFIKEGTFNDLKETFNGILRYWFRSKMPSKTGK